MRPAPVLRVPAAVIACQLLNPGRRFNSDSSERARMSAKAEKGCSPMSTARLPVLLGVNHVRSLFKTLPRRPSQAPEKSAYRFGTLTAAFRRRTERRRADRPLIGQSPRPSVTTKTRKSANLGKQFTCQTVFGQLTRYQRQLLVLASSAGSGEPICIASALICIRPSIRRPKSLPMNSSWRRHF